MHAFLLALLLSVPAITLCYELPQHGRSLRQQNAAARLAAVAEQDPAQSRSGTGAPTQPQMTPVSRLQASSRPELQQTAAASASSRPLLHAAAMQQSTAVCPPDTDPVTAPGCLCSMSGLNNPNNEQQVSLGVQRPQQHNTTQNVCPAGYRCSPSAAQVLVAAGWAQRNSSNLTKLFDWPAGGRLGPALATRGVCVPCQLGEFCQAGSEEETWLSLSTCQLQKLGHHPGQATLQNVDEAASTQPCKGFKACPAGSFCPNSSTLQACPPGRWCPQGSITSETCNLTGLLVWNPFRTVSSDPMAILEILVNAAQPLDGVTCPANATTPLAGCPAGYFCPNAIDKEHCPQGFYCPGHTSAPVPCPVLSNCVAMGLTAPDWSWLGLLLLLLLLILLLAVLEYVRVSGRRGLQSSTQEEELMQLIAAVGFKVVGTQGDTVELHRVGRARQHSSSHHAQALDTATHAPLATNSRTLQRAWSVIKGLLPGLHHDGTFATTPSAAFSKDAAVDTAAAHTNTASKRTTVWAKLLAWAATGKQSANAAAAAASGASHTVVNIAPAQPAGAAVRQSTFSKLHSDVDSSLESEESDEEETKEYIINPRLTLAFDEVWVADRGMSHGIRHKLTQQVTRLCCPGSTSNVSVDAPDIGVSTNSRHRSDVSQQSSKSSSTPAPHDLLLSLGEELEAAAARGVKFIIPGASGRFPHSQLHAIMGPSGCGKTSLCKALARRLPLNRFLGDIRVLVSSAADNYSSESRLSVCSAKASGRKTSGVALAARNIETMIGFVPQFDLLHESLTVMENLGVAAMLRLPVGAAAEDAGDTSSCCGRRRRRHKQREQEVHITVAEVMALMALTKVAHQVVGSSSARMLSGGQRKRVAIGVELVAKPSLLFLDEPTSGLDAAVAYDVIGALKSSTERGMNVLAVLHQPRFAIFNMFDSCLLLSSCGHVVYHGPQRLALPYMNFLGFSVPPGENLADFLMDVIAGVVPRPGDPNYIPSQLSTYWSKCGDIWIDGQLAAADNPQQLEGTTAELLQAASLAPTSAQVDWPWRPRDLEALLSRFNLLVDSKRAARGRAGSSSGGGAEGGAVLTYDGFLTFWDDSGLKEMLGEEQFAEFIGGVCEDFGMAPGSSITQVQFMQVLQAQLRAAVAPAAAAETAAAATAAAVSTPRAADAGAGATARLPGLERLEEHEVLNPVSSSETTELGHRSVFAAYSGRHTYEEDDQLLELCSLKAAADAAACGSPCHEDAAACAAELCAAAAADPAAVCAELAAVRECADMEAAAGCAELAAVAECADLEAAAGCAELAAVTECAELAAAAECADFAAAAECAELAAAAGCAGSAADAEELAAACPAAAKVCTPGMLTCAAARMRQHQLRRQRSRRPLPDPQVCLQQREQQKRQHLEAMQRLRRASSSRPDRTLLSSPGSITGLQQLREARLLRAPSVVRLRSAAGLDAQGLPPRSSCTDLAMARSRCLDELGDFLLMRHLQAQQQGLGPGASQGQGGQAGRLPASMYGTAAAAAAAVSKEPASVPAAAKASPVEWPQPLHVAGQTSRTRLPSDMGETSCQSAMAAVAAVASRKLPPPRQQMLWVIRRNVRKWVSSRGALMSDLIMTAMLGLALGVAQGRNSSSPSSSVLWLLITLLAYGCTMLARSIHTYGSERHLFLQLESQGGVSTSAWVFGLQIFDLLALIVHPALFFAWMYVLTLSPVPAWSYYVVLVFVGWYTSGIGYLVSLALPPRTALIAGLAASLLLGGVANGVAPRLWQITETHPIMWLDQISYTRWGLQALYTSWLTPTTAAQAPATAAFLAGLGFCGLDGRLLQALDAEENNTPATASNSTGVLLNATTGSQEWWRLNSTERADALAAGAAAEVERSRSSGSLPSTDAAGAAAITQLWSYYNHPEMLRYQCRRKQIQGYCVLMGLGLLCRLLVWLLVKFKVHKKAQE